MSKFIIFLPRIINLVLSSYELHCYFAHQNSREIMKDKNLQKYWKTNLRYLGILLSIWFIVSYGFGIIWADNLNAFKLGGFPLGFWFAQQGSIYMFLVLIFIYVVLMNRLDKKFDVDEK